MLDGFCLEEVQTAPEKSSSPHLFYSILSYTYLSTYLPIYLSTYLPIYLSTCLPIYLSTYLAI